MSAIMALGHRWDEPPNGYRHRCLLCGAERQRVFNPYKGSALRMVVNGKTVPSYPCHNSEIGRQLAMEISEPSWQKMDRKRECLDKMRYATTEAATSAAGTVYRERGTECRMYRCRFCYGIHLTRRSEQIATESRHVS